MSDTQDVLTNDMEFERALLRSATTDTEPSGSRDQMLARLGLAAGAPLAANAATAKGASAALTKALLAAFGAVTLGAIGIVAWPPSPPPPPSPSAAAAHVENASAAVEPSAEKGVRVDDLPAAPTALPRVVRVEGAPPAASASAGDSLGREIALVAKAREAVARGDTTTAKAHLAIYRAELGDGALGAEALALEVESARLDGDSAKVRSLGTSYLRRFPGTPHAARIRRWVDELEPR